MRPYLKRKNWAWWSIPVIPAMLRSTNRMTAVQASLNKKQDPISKIIRAKRVRGVDQIIRHLPA
jgi:hypothetical protein